MTSRIPKYQFEAIIAKRSGKGLVTFKYQQRLQEYQRRGWWV